MDAEAIRAGGRDAYVKARILDRIKEPEVRDALPAVVLLGRFDRAMLEPAIEADPSRTMIALTQQEFVDVVGGAGPETWTLQVEPQLLERLRAWYRRRSRAPSSRRERSSGRHWPGCCGGRRRAARRRARGRGDASLPVEDAIAFWSSFEPHLASKCAWSVARAASERLLDPWTTAAMEDPLLRARSRR